MSTLLNGLVMLLAFLVLLGVIVFIHEFGHFIVAKAFKIKVVTFSLGFPPKMVGFKWGETEYCLSWIPLGGYCAMLGESGQDDEIAPEDLPRCYCNQVWWKRALVLVAGPCMNLVLPLFLYGAVFHGTHDMYIPAIGYVSANSAAAKAGVLPGDVITAINGEPVATFDDMQRLTQGSEGQIKLNIRRDSGELTILLTPDTVTDSDLLGDKITKKRMGVALLGQRAVFAVSDEQSPAYRAGLRTGDQLLELNGVATESWAKAKSIVSQIQREQPLTLKVKRPASETAGESELTLTIDGDSDIPENYPKTAWSSLEPSGPLYWGIGLADDTIERLDDGDNPARVIGLQVGDRLLKMDGVAINFWEMDLQAIDVTTERTIEIEILRGREFKKLTYDLKRIEPDYLANPKKEAQRNRFGAYNYGNAFLQSPTIPVSVGFLASIGKAIQKVSEDIVLTYRALFKLFTGQVSMDSMGGPIMIFFIAGEAVEYGIDHFLSIMAFISINIGLLNLLPIPPLDGGHLLGVIIEAILRRPLKPEVKAGAQMVGTVLLLLLMVVAFKNDAIRYFIH